MPIYEYRCTECQQLFEEWSKHVEDSNKSYNCPICKGQARRIMSNTSFALKGDGWYATDYGSRRSDTASSEAPAACVPSGSCTGAGACNATAGTSA
jgi:putative FmdB family regulatory protein